MNRICLLLLILSLGYVPSAHADSVQNALDQRYKNQVIPLRYPFVQGDQNFDSTGRPLNNASGSWLVYGAIFVQSLHISPDTLRLEGPRIALTQPKGNEKPVAVQLERSVKVVIHLDHPINTIEEAQALLSRVFYLDGDYLQHVRPEYRRSDQAVFDEPVYKLANSGENHVKTPRPKYTPEPEFTDQARRAQAQGTVTLSIVVDKSGNVFRIRIEQPAGMGLDENAVEAVKQWRFSPGTHDGEPVPVEMKIEVSFNLYSNH